MARVKIAEFGIIQKSLAGASVAVYESDGNGESTGTLATLYQESTGSGTRSNPQTLDDDGKLENDCYITGGTTVVAAISNISVATERSIRKIRVNPLEYPLPVTSAMSLSSEITADDITAQVLADLTLGWEGAWVTATAYAVGNIVSSGGSSYICELAHTSGASTQPGVGGSWTTYWDLFAQQGSAGAGSGDMLAANNLSDVANATTARANLGLAIGSNVQAYDADLAAIAGLTSAADTGIMFSGSGTAATFTLTAAGLALLDDANAAAQRTTLGLGTISTYAFIDEDDMVSDSAVSIPSQQSVKAYVDASVASPITAATQANQETATSTAVYVSPGRQQYHPSAAKFWADISQSGATATLSASYNVTSITDGGLQVTITIAIDFSSANWCCIPGFEGFSAGEAMSVYATSKAAGSVIIAGLDEAAAAADPLTGVNVAGYGDQ